MSKFKTKKIKTSFVQHLQAPPSKVFPLLCPVREYEWIEPWSCEMLHSESGIAEKNCVFRTRFHTDTSDDIWVVSLYDPYKKLNLSELTR